MRRFREQITLWCIIKIKFISLAHGQLKQKEKNIIDTPVAPNFFV